MKFKNQGYGFVPDGWQGHPTDHRWPYWNHDKRFLEALKQFKATGKPDAILQSKKLDALREDLKNIDLTKITGEQYKRLKNNYCEQTEFHHRTNISLSVLAVSIVAQGVFGGTAGIIVATAAGIITVTYSITDAVHQRNFAERIRIYTIEQYTPYFAWSD